MQNQNKIIKLTFLLALSIVLLMVIVFSYDYYFKLELYQYGLKPRSISGLLGIITSPFIHSTVNFSHIINNSAPALVLTWLLFYNFRSVGPRVYILIYLFTGILVWLFGRDSYHIGMSGIIYGETAFLILSGFLTKNLRMAGLSMLVIFMYGSIIWGIFPQDPSISWEGHFFGFFVGISLALYYKKYLPQADKFKYEIEEEFELEPIEEYWKEDYNSSFDNENSNQKIHIIYNYTPNKPKDTSNSEE